MRRLAVLGLPPVDRWRVVELIAGRLGVPMVSMYTVFQTEFRAQSPASVEFGRFMDAGELVPDEVMLPVLLTHLDGPGFVLDGFPHTAVQAEMLTEALAGRGTPLDRVVDLVLSDGEVLRRVTGRRVCRGCGKVWHVEPAPARCDRCGGEVFQRDDDAEWHITARLQSFRSNAAPILEHYRSLELLVSVDATLPPEEIAEAATC
ncbi:nucleoside monophosphate kinase [Dactylosporangium sp. NPDC049525]|uniref:adenylate kinase family protein n=1 Tax=Dactylosporangium sp. NPDC049525 TaxID=3154730 RepID=UPI003448778F